MRQTIQARAVLRAQDRLRLRGARLMKMNAKNGGHTYHIVPGSEVDEEIARLLIARPDVVVMNKDITGKPNAWGISEWRD